MKGLLPEQAHPLPDLPTVLDNWWLSALRQRRDPISANGTQDDGAWMRWFTGNKTDRTEHRDRRQADTPRDFAP